MDDEGLLHAVAGGDHRAFAALMERHGSFAMTLAVRMTGTQQDAEEVAQEAFLRVWTAAERWDSSGGARFTTWLYRVVMNLCLDRRRRAPMLAMDDVAEPMDPGPNGLDRYTTGQARELVVKALETLPDRQRAAVSLCYFGEVSCQEAADTLEISLSALESLLVRGRRTLRDYLTRRGLKTMGDVL